MDEFEPEDMMDGQAFEYDEREGTAEEKQSYPENISAEELLDQFTARDVARLKGRLYQLIKTIGYQNAVQLAIEMLFIINRYEQMYPMVINKESQELTKKIRHYRFVYSSVVKVIRRAYKGEHISMINMEFINVSSRLIEYQGKI